MSEIKAEGAALQSREKEHDKNRLELILEESEKLSAEEQECVLATLRGMVFTRKCFLEKGKHEEEKSE